MKHRIIAIALLLAIMVMLGGCEAPPLPNKPEDAVNDFMTQEKLMEVLTLFDDVSGDDVEDIATAFWVDVLTSPSIKSVLLDNVRSISYNITNTKINGDNATVSAIITHKDLTPVMDKSMEIFFDKLRELDASGVEAPEDEDELMEMLLPIVSQSIKEATTKTKPTETYTKIQYDCEKNTSGRWVLSEIPDAFLDKVLFMNIEGALEQSWDENYNMYMNYG